MDSGENLNTGIAGECHQDSAKYELKQSGQVVSALYSVWGVSYSACVGRLTLALAVFCGGADSYFWSYFWSWQPSAAVAAQPPASAWIAQRSPSPPAPEPAEKAAPGFSLEQWKEQYGRRVDLRQWMQQHPFPWGGYFDGKNAECEKKWFFELGPLGVRVAWRDVNWLHAPAFKAAFPAALVNGGAPVANAIEVLYVNDDGPAAGRLQTGDLIVEIDGQPIRSAEYTYRDRELLAKNTRMLEIHAGQLIDAAEGQGHISMKILRGAPAGATEAKVTDIPATTEKLRNQPVEVDISGMKGVSLVAQYTGTGNGSCWINWLAPRLEGPAGTLDLAKFKPVVAASGWGTVHYGADVEGKPVMLNGQTVGSVIGSHANSTLTWVVPAGYTTLKVAAHTPRSTSIRCQVKLHPAQPFQQLDPLTLPANLEAHARQVEFDIPKIGSFGERFDPHCEKLKNYSAMLAARLAVQQLPDGTWESVPGSYAEPAFHSSMAALGLMATGDPAYAENVKRAARRLAVIDKGAGQRGGWAYPQGVRLLFLSEYYLRTGDDAIVPAIQEMVDTICRDYLTVDYVAGHKKTTPGYGASGWIGATGPIVLGLAAASRTPARVSPHTLQGMFDVIQELGLMYGGLPYGRGGQNERVALPKKTYSQSKGSGAGNGGCVIATLLGGGGQEFAEYSRKRLGEPPWGDDDGGHASHTLPYVWTSLACAAISEEAHRGNMEAFLWRLTLQRNYDGFINHNTNMLEYRGAEGVIGKPYWSTGGILMVLNAHKQNLFLTGLKKYRTLPRDIPFTQIMDRRFRLVTLNNWNIVEAVLLERAPASLAPALKKVRALPENGAGLGNTLFEFLRTDAPRVAAEVLATPGLEEPMRSWCAELLLGVKDSGNGPRHSSDYFTRKDAKATTPIAEYVFNPQLAPPHIAWVEDAPPTSSLWKGAITLTDPAGKHPEKPVVVKLEPGQKPKPVTISFPTKPYPVVVAYDYVLEGVRIHYERPLIVNPTTDTQRSRFFRVRSTVDREMDTELWRWPIKLVTGGRLEATKPEVSSLPFHLPDGTTKDFGLPTLRPGQWYDLIVAEAWYWGEVPVYEVYVK